MKILPSFLKLKLSARKTPLPMVMTPYRAALEKTQKQYFVGLVLLLCALGYYSYFYIDSQANAQKLSPRLSAKTDLIYPHVLTSEDLIFTKIPNKWLPEGSFENAEFLVGKTLVRSIVKNEVLVAADIALQQDPNSITAQFKEDFAFTIGEDWLVSKLPGLSKGDLIDVLVTNPKLSNDSTITIASGLKVIKVDLANGRKNLVLNVTTQQAQGLLFSRGLRLPMQILIHSAPQHSPSNLLF
ncbi:hypothetical protein GW756_01020 [bacterium]|nr:hypothetical protein [bacterium]NCQ54938.1 hypothetical protein [Candidatus Parcubacteria bacterium]NCS66982.1 hypothetical protein [Candidatus Peregrinibacteria bacterium]NCS95928.1 hypothetical protein [bacterium]